MNSDKECIRVEDDIIYDKIEEWHFISSTISLHEYLGITLKEYAAFVERIFDE